MPADTTNLGAAIAGLLTQVEATKTVQASATALITGFAAIVIQKVTEALTADNAADQGSIDAAAAAIQAAVAEVTSSTTALGDAVAANG